MSADDVAKDLIRHIRKGTFMIIPGLDGKISFIAKRFLPRIVEFVMDREIKKVHRKSS
jgi:short-subunit dehydrogenase